MQKRENIVDLKNLEKCVFECKLSLTKWRTSSVKSARSPYTDPPGCIKIDSQTSKSCECRLLGELNDFFLPKREGSSAEGASQFVAVNKKAVCVRVRARCFPTSLPKSGPRVSQSEHVTQVSDDYVVTDTVLGMGLAGEVYRLENVLFLISFNFFLQM